MLGAALLTSRAAESQETDQTTNELVATATLEIGGEVGDLSLRRAEEHERFSAARSQIADEWMALQKLHRDDPAAVRGLAFQQWREHNRERLEAMRKQAGWLAKSRKRPEPILIDEVEIAEDATAEMEEFLVERARFYNERAQLRYQLRDGTPDESAEALEAWREQKRDRLRVQQSRSELLSAQSPRVSQPFPAEPYIPRGASTALESFLTARHALARDSRAEEDRTRDLPPAEKDLARQQWHQRNSDRLAALAELARKLSE